VKRIPGAVAFVFFICVCVTITNLLTTPAATRLNMFVGGVITTVLFSLIVAGGIWLRNRLRRTHPNGQDPPS
jgi:hypothetical protein